MDFLRGIGRALWGLAEDMIDVLRDFFQNCVELVRMLKEK